MASNLRRTTSAVAAPLALLDDLEIVARTEDTVRRRRPRWTIADPLLRFWLAIMRPDCARLEQGRAEEVWHDATQRWQTQVLGPTVEELAREWVGRYANQLGPLRRVGSAVVNDAQGRAQHEVDIVGISADTGRVTVIGEAKAGQVGRRELARLERVRSVLVDRGLAHRSATLVLVALGGVEHGLAARRPDLVVADAADLYGITRGER